MGGFMPPQGRFGSAYFFLRILSCVWVITFVENDFFTLFFDMFLTEAKEVPFRTDKAPSHLFPAFFLNRI